MGDNPSNLLLTRLSAIGDCILTIPLAVHIKRLWPKCRLTWVVDCAAEQLLAEHACIDEVIRVEKGWLKRPGLWQSLRGELQSRQFDVVLDPQGLTKSAALGWLSCAKTRVGFDYSHAREIAPLLANCRIHRTQRHMVDTYLQLLSPWEQVPPGSGEFEMPIYEQAAERATSILHDCDFVGREQSQSRWVAINPGAGWSTKLWPCERFGHLARAIYEKHGLQSLVFWAGQDEFLLANVIAEESRGAAVVAPATSLCEMLELLRRTSLLVSADTGPLHMASSVGTPCVSLHGPTWADECGPYGNRHVSIQSPTPHLSKQQVRRGPNIAMQAIEVDEVIRACDRLLHLNPASQRSAA